MKFNRFLIICFILLLNIATVVAVDADDAVMAVDDGSYVQAINHDDLLETADENAHSAQEDIDIETSSSDAEVLADERMIEHFKKTTSYVCQLSNGGFLAFEKQSIETSFCFGYSYTRDESDYKDANKMAAHAKTNEDYFIERNLEQFDWKLEKINKEDADIYIFRKHSKSKANVYDFYVLDFYEVNANYYKHLNLQKASEEDKNIIINAIKAERAKFEKRLRTYLKKYGLSKVHAWTYWGNE